MHRKPTLCRRLLHMHIEEADPCARAGHVQPVAPGIFQLGRHRPRIGPADRRGHDPAGVDRKSKAERLANRPLRDADRMPVAHHVEFYRVRFFGEDLRPHALAITMSGVGRAGRVTKSDMRAGNVAPGEVAAFEQHAAADLVRMGGDRNFEFLFTAVACVASEVPAALGEGGRAEAGKDEDGRQDAAQESIGRHHITPVAERPSSAWIGCRAFKLIKDAEVYQRKPAIKLLYAPTADAG
jgi:hypothetical protein